MTDKKEITIRPAKHTDIENLKNFFIKAYGNQTIFQDGQFLEYYFRSIHSNKPTFINSLIGINEKEEIVSHYGGLDYSLIIKNKSHSLIWGVNAYTLPDYRGKGVNSKILDYFIKNNEINGVIGFTDSTASFYQKTGYNIFNYNKFNRYILILDHKKTLEVCNYINENSEKLFSQELIYNKKQVTSSFGEIVELTKNNIDKYKLNLDEDFSEITTTNRTKDFLMWRFFENPFIKYSVYGIVNDNSLNAYIAIREEKLNPLNYKVSRIIDLYGQKDLISTLLKKGYNESILKKHIYIDFSMFGSIYEPELKSFNFIHLENDECSILPQVSSPIEKRANFEFIGFISKTLNQELSSITKENVYFTRMDSDRDRLAKIN